jgi:hypothetical protein
MIQNQIKLLVGGLCIAGIFALVLPWASRIHIQREKERTLKEEIAEGRAQIINGHLRKINERLWALEWKVNFGTDLPKNSPPGEAASLDLNPSVVPPPTPHPVITAEPAVKKPLRKDQRMVEITGPGSPVIAGGNFTVNVEFANIGKKEIKLIRSQYCDFRNQWMTDNPQLHIPIGVCIDQIDVEHDPNKERRLKPGETHSGRIAIVIEKKQPMPKSIKFKLGFKETPQSALVWSNPVEVKIQKEEALPVDIKASAEATKMATGASLKINVRITNTSDHEQWIGTEICGVHGVTDWTLDDPAVRLVLWGCLANLAPPQDIVLKPGETYEQDLKAAVPLANLKKDLTFRLGLKPLGYIVNWSNPIVIP